MSEFNSYTGKTLVQMKIHANQQAVEIERLRAALKTADDSIRHHLRADSIGAAMIQPHAVRAIREALNAA